VGDVVKNPEGGLLFDLYYAEGDSINKASSDRDGEIRVSDIERKGPPRRGRRFSDIACNGEEVFVLEDRGTTLWKIAGQHKETKRVGSLFWAPVAVACFEKQLFIAELPRLLLRWMIGWWKPVRVRRIQFADGTSSRARGTEPANPKASKNPSRAKSLEISAG
jgi:hypothetical protein